MLQMGCFSITWKFLAILYALMAGGLGIALVSSISEFLFEDGELKKVLPAI